MNNQNEANPAAKNGEAPSTTLSGRLEALRRNIDPKLIKTREGWRDRNGNVHTVDYVEWHTVADILDQHAPNWIHKICDVREIGDVVVVIVSITVGGISREGIGTGAAGTELGIKKAEHDALKRAAVKFGVGRELYKKESEFIERHGSADGETSYANNGIVFPRNPQAKSNNDLVSARQLGMIRALARECEIDADEECKAVMDIATDELNKKAASAFIGHLQAIAGGFAEAAKVGEETVKKNAGNVVSLPEEKLKAIGRNLADEKRVEVDEKTSTAVVTEIKDGQMVKFALHKNGIITCSCARYQYESKKNKEFWCEHKWALRFHMEAKKQEQKS